MPPNSPTKRLNSVPRNSTFHDGCVWLTDSWRNIAITLIGPDGGSSLPEPRGKSRLVQMGFWVGGPPGYGYRRMMVSADGKPKQKMKDGERKSLTTDRVILVPGPRTEIECVRHMFSMVVDGRHSCTEIALDLNRRGITVYGKPWTNKSVFNLLTNPKYAGCNIWHRRSQRLRNRRVPVASERWITTPGAFTPIIYQQTFDKVQALLPRHADTVWTDKKLLTRVRRLLKSKGRLTSDMNLSRLKPKTVAPLLSSLSATSTH